MMPTDSSTLSLDLDFVRSHFPALDKEWVYMDNAGGSQTLKGVADRISEYLLTSIVQHGASYAISQLAMQRVKEATAAMATLVNAADPQEIVMGGSTTLMIRLLSLSFAQTLKPGDEIIVSNSDHEANVSPWIDLRKQGIVVHVWKVRPDTMRFDLKDLDALMNENTRLVAVTHTSNVLGTLNPIREIARFVHEKGALICVDGVAHAPHRLVDVQNLDADFYLFSTYKVYGPHYALMYGKKELLLSLPGLNHYFIEEDDLPYKFQPGNVNFELCYGLLGLTDYLAAVAAHHYEHPASDLRGKMVQAFNLFNAHEERLADRLVNYLQTKPGIRIIGETGASQELRVPTISFVHEHLKSDEIVAQVDPFKVAIRFGDFYAKKLIQDLGLESHNGVIRVSMVHYNTLAEVDQLIAALETIFP